MQRLFKTDAGFRRLELSGTTLTLLIGKTGSAGQKKVLSFATEAEARQELDRIIGFSGPEVPLDLWSPTPARTASLATEQSEDAKELLGRLDGLIRRIRPEFYESLNPGASAAELLEAERAIGCRIPETLKQLYQWKNGTKGQDFLRPAFIANWAFVPLQVLSEDWKANAGMIGYDFEAENWFHEGWLPFMSRGNGDHLCVDVFGAFDGTAGQIVEFIHDDPLRPVEAPSLHLWLHALVAAVEALARVPADDEFDPDLDSWIKTHCRGYPRDFTAG